MFCSGLDEAWKASLSSAKISFGSLAEQPQLQPFSRNKELYCIHLYLCKRKVIRHDCDNIMVHKTNILQIIFLKDF